MPRALILLLFAVSCLLSQQPASHPFQEQFEQGQRALGEARYAEAAKVFENLIKLEPGIAELHASLGVSYFQQREFERAVPALRQSLKLNPKLPNADILLAMSLAELGHHHEALPGLEKGFKNAWDPALRRMAGLQLQRAYTALQRDNEAAETSLELTRLYPKDPEVLYHAIRVYGNLAYLTARKLSEEAPDSVWRRQAAGEAYESQGDYDLAIEQYRQVLALAPDRLGIHFRLGRVFLLRSRDTDIQDAAKEFSQELQLDPSNANAAYELGEIHRKSAQLDKAIEFFTAALGHYPDFEEARLGLSRALIAQQRPDLALPHLKKAVSLNPQNEIAHYQLWQVHRALGNAAEQEKALAEFRRLRSEKSRREEAVKEVFFPTEVTKQELDAEAPP